MRITHSKHKEDGTYTSVEIEATLEELAQAAEAFNATEKLWKAMFGSDSDLWYIIRGMMP